MGATEQRRTRARGNGHLRENKIERLALDQGRTIEPDLSNRHTHITYTRGHCEFRFDDDARCVWVGQLLDGVCAEHRYVLQCREQSRKVSERKRAARQAAWDRGMGK